MHHIHTNEDITITYKRNGQYDEAALEKINWFLRDWRRSEQTRMDPHLIDLLWEVHRETGSKEPIWIVCGYRSPATNAMLRRRSRGVARFSQHMLGHATDFYIPGVPLEELRVIGLRLQRGGVGFYPTSGSPFVHMDTGGIRMWPRMTRDQLSRVFPDGRTVYLPTDGRPLKGYALALADVRRRGNDVGAVVASDDSPRAGPLAKVFKVMSDDGDDDADTAAPATPAVAPTPPASTAAAAQQKPTVVAAAEHRAEQKTAAAQAATAKAATPPPAAVAAPPVPPHAPTAQAKAGPPAAAAAHRASTQVAAAMTPNEVIQTRGYWLGIDSMPAAPAAPTAHAAHPRAAATAPRRYKLASADATGSARTSASPFVAGSQDHVPPELALAYAEQPGREPARGATAVAPMGGAKPHAAEPQAKLQPPPYGTTIAVKRSPNQMVSTILTAPQVPASAVTPGTRFDNPWLRAVMLSPNARRFLTTAMLGTQDSRALTGLMYKPADSVVMKFSAEPYVGLTDDRFSGSAVVFISTVKYTTHTASLR